MIKTRFKIYPIQLNNGKIALPQITAHILLKLPKRNEWRQHLTEFYERGCKAALTCKQM